ncbi:MAG: transporter suffix domain-containing protein [Piscirickettsiaceae bacterium]|nr:transporter suffix domain-containing protein [Piscirickettsiaceae bacterium]
MKKMFGYLFLILSFVTWGVVVLLPFIDISKGQVAGITTALIVTGEVLFLVSIALLGKEAWEHIKAIFKRKK